MMMINNNDDDDDDNNDDDDDNVAHWSHNTVAWYRYATHFLFNVATVVLFPTSF